MEYQFAFYPTVSTQQFNYPVTDSNMASNVEDAPVAHHVSGRQFKVYNVLMILAMGFGSVSYGYSAGVISQTLGQPSFLRYFGLDKRSDATDLIGLMNSLYQAGGFIGTFCVSFFADRYGRRAGIAIPSVLNIIAGALLAGSVNIGMFIVSTNHASVILPIRPRCNILANLCHSSSAFFLAWLHTGSCQRFQYS
jgi:MFS family permease